MKIKSIPNKSRRGKKSKISFDEEIISKDEAEKLLSEQDLQSVVPKNQILERNEPQFKTNNKKRKLLEKSAEGTKKLKPKKKRSVENQILENNDSSAEPSSNIEHTQEQGLTNQPKKESNRAQKRKKHAEIVEQKKLKVEVELQQKTLNYLSKWKHTRSEWKFEKLRQVWIQQNLFDASKIPDEFWEITVEYFSGAMGHSRQVALDEALKIIDNEDKNTEENLNEDYQLKLKRARSIVQNLQ